MLNKEIVSAVVNDLRALSISDRISERFVLKKLVEHLGLFLKRENDQLRLYSYDDIWTTIDCVAMQSVEASTCLGIRIPKVTRYMMSIKPIPELYSYRNGLLIRSVMSVDDGNLYNQSSPTEFANIIKRDFVSNTRYYWFKNGHLVIPNGPEAIQFTACFVEQYKALELCTCNNVTCIDPMNDYFPCPSHLLQVVRQEAVKDLFNFYKRVVQDENPDLDSNTKTERPNG